MVYKDETDMRPLDNGMLKTSCRKISVIMATWNTRTP